MTAEFDFSRDHEFQRLIDRDPGADLTVLALELARDAYPDLDFNPVLTWIRARGAELRSLVLRTSGERETLELVARVIAAEHGITGDPAAYDEADGSFLNQVVQKQRGIPISLSVLYMAVCREAGIELQGVSTPMHFLTRLDAPEGPLFFDAFDGHRILTHDETIQWLSERTGMPGRPIARSLQPVDTRNIVVRMLTNLKVLYARQENWSAAWPVQNRLLALNPSEYTERRDLALIAVRACRPGTAIRLIRSLLKNCPETDRRLLEDHLRESSESIHQWN